MSPLGNEDARAQVGTKGGLSQRWREAAKHSQYDLTNARADELDAAKLRIEEAVKALPFKKDWWDPRNMVDREAVLKIIREIL